MMGAGWEVKGGTIGAIGGIYRGRGGVYMGAGRGMGGIWSYVGRGGVCRGFWRDLDGSCMESMGSIGDL